MKKHIFATLLILVLGTGISYSHSSDNGPPVQTEYTLAKQDATLNTVTNCTVIYSDINKEIENSPEIAQKNQVDLPRDAEVIKVRLLYPPGYGLSQSGIQPSYYILYRAKNEKPGNDPRINRKLHRKGATGELVH